MTRASLLSLLLLLPAATYAQSTTTQDLLKKHKGALSFFFYNNTLRMINQNDDEAFDKLIEDIEKMRFLVIRKTQTNVDNNDFKNLVADYRSEAFEPVMTSRHEGKQFDVYLKENQGKTEGMLVLINDAENLYVLDILGRIALDKISSLYRAIDGSTDIGSKIKAFAGGDKGNEGKPK
jgi:hypothetical protein